MSTLAGPSDVVAVAEWSDIVVPCDQPTDQDEALADQLASSAPAKLDVRWLPGSRMRLRTSSWIGFVRIAGRSVRIIPKYVGAELGVLRMLAFTTGLNRLVHLPNEDELPTGSPFLLELLCRVLLEEVDHLLVAGLVRDYVMEDDDLAVLRGSLRIREQVTRRFGRIDRLECRFDDYHANTLHNQLLVTGLGAAAALPVSSPTKNRLRAQQVAVQEVAEPGPTAPAYYRQRLVYDRRTDAYRPAHELCLQLLDMMSLRDLHTSGPQRVFAFLLDMNQLFEDVVTRLVVDAFAGTDVTVEAQKRIRSTIRDDTTGSTYTTIVPDLVLARTDPEDPQRLPIDAKYKRYDQRRISADDIFQTFVYAYALTSPRERHAGIIFPSQATRFRPRLSIINAAGTVGARITGLGLNLPAILDALAAGDGPRAAALSEIRDTLTTMLPPSSPR